MNTHLFKILQFRLFLIIGVFASLSFQAKSAEFVVLNRTYTYTYPEPSNGGAFNCNTKNFSGMPSNWLSPNDYWNGHFYYHIELIDIPTNNEVGFQFGIYQYYLYNGQDYYETCSLTRASLQGSGDVAEGDYGSPANWWQHPNGGVDFTKPNEFEEAGLAIWSHMPGHVGIICPSASGGDDIANAVREYYEPCTIRVIVVAVSQGSTFSGWDNYVNGGPVTPPTPSYTINYGWESTNQNVPSTDEYSYSSGMSPAYSGSGSPVYLTPGQDVYFRTKASGGNPVSSVQHLSVPSRPSAPSAYTINYSSEKTTENVTSDIEYSTSSSFNSSNVGTGVQIYVTPGQNLYFRKKATGSAFASSSTQLVVPSRPSAPSVSVNFTNEKTNESLGSTIKYSTNPSMS
jgi:hypothetical protein